jgi:hypothetical protein
VEISINITKVHFCNTAILQYCNISLFEKYYNNENSISRVEDSDNYSCSKSISGTIPGVYL